MRAVHSMHKLYLEGGGTFWKLSDLIIHFIVHLWGGGFFFFLFFSFFVWKMKTKISSLLAHLKFGFVLLQWEDNGVWNQFFFCNFYFSLSFLYLLSSPLFFVAFLPWHRWFKCSALNLSYFNESIVERFQLLRKDFSKFTYILFTFTCSLTLTVVALSRVSFTHTTLVKLLLLFFYIRPENRAALLVVNVKLMLPRAVLHCIICLAVWNKGRRYISTLTKQASCLCDRCIFKMSHKYTHQII